MMVVEEEKGSKEFMDRWRSEYCSDKKHKEQCDRFGAGTYARQIFYQKSLMESCSYIKEMDKKYEALGDNPGLTYPIFTQYRQYTSNPKACASSGIYPENKKLQKLISEELRSAISGVLK